MAIRTVQITTLGQLLDEVTPDEPDPHTGRWRDSGVYRGAADPEWPLMTSLDRLGGHDAPHGKRDLEAHILRNFIRYSRPHLDGAENAWELLVAAQHHGVPTRLLDWTYSPLVAAHFATARHPEAEGDRAVWRLDWKRVHRAFGLPELALLLQDVERLLGGGEGKPCTPWALFERDIERGAAPVACMIEPPSLDARIIAQSATFTLTSDTTRTFDRFLEAHGLEDALTRYVIPARSVPRLRDQLDLVGVDERLLFPDLDGVAARIRRYYS